jgi:hypothetical protein
MWLAGAGIRRGMVYGSTDELGYAAVENVCTVHDLHATMLHQLGIRHDAFSVKFQGLDARLTGVEGARVIDGILARRRGGRSPAHFFFGASPFLAASALAAASILAASSSVTNM